MAEFTTVPERYLAAMNAADIESMMSLFAEGAVLRHPSGIYDSGARIREFFLELAFANDARLTAQHSFQQEDTAVLEAWAESTVTPGRQWIVDVFRLDGSGLIEDLGVYLGAPVEDSP
ncbi:nuclear transport factor 2 family protein [Myxococcota bacterium]|nr:nuclear transport factor 2 family protein [Myxococcota bacterium]